MARRERRPVRQRLRKRRVPLTRGHGSRRLSISISSCGCCPRRQELVDDGGVAKGSRVHQGGGSGVVRDVDVLLSS